MCNIDLFGFNAVFMPCNGGKDKAFAIQQGLTNFVANSILSAMATKTMNISLTPELKASIELRVRSGRYGNASDVIRAGLRALVREEMAASYREFQEIMAQLPQDPVTPEIEQRISRRVNQLRQAEKQKARK